LQQIRNEVLAIAGCLGTFRYGIVIDARLFLPLADQWRPHFLQDTGGRKQEIMPAVRIYGFTSQDGCTRSKVPSIPRPDACPGGDAVALDMNEPNVEGIVGTWDTAFSDRTLPFLDEARAWHLLFVTSGSPNILLA